MVSKILSLCLITIILLYTMACTAIHDVDSNGTNNTGHSKAATLNIWIMPNSNDAEKDFIELLEPFHKENPNIKVVPTIISWESAWDKIVLTIAGGDAPDITQLGTTWLAAIANTGELQDLTGKYNEDRFIEESLKTTVIEDAKGQFSNKQRFAIPWFAETRFLLYRRDAILKAGVNPDTDFATWESFKAALKKLQDIEINGKRLCAMGMPGKNDWNVVHYFSFWIWGAGGDFLSPDYKQCTINSKQSFEGINYYTGLATEGLLSAEALEKNMNEVILMFNEGQFATMISSSNSNIKFDDNVRVALIPAGPKGRVAFLGGSVLAVYKSSKKTNEAEKLLKYLTSRNAQIEYSRKTQYLPVLKDAYNDPYISTDRIRRVLKDQIRFARTYPSITSWGPIENIFKNGLGEVWDTVMVGEGSNDSSRISKKLDDIANRVNEELNRN